MLTTAVNTCPLLKPPMNAWPLPTNPHMTAPATPVATPHATPLHHAEESLDLAPGSRANCYYYYHRGPQGAAVDDVVVPSSGDVLSDAPPGGDSSVLRPGAAVMRQLHNALRYAGGRADGGYTPQYVAPCPCSCMACCATLGGMRIMVGTRLSLYALPLSCMACCAMLWACG